MYLSERREGRERMKRQRNEYLSFEAVQPIVSSPYRSRILTEYLTSFMRVLTDKFVHSPMDFLSPSCAGEQTYHVTY